MEVNLPNVVANARTVAAEAKGAALLPMVKADAYGLGAVEVARALEAVAPWGFGVATVAEAVALRAAGVRRPIVVFTPARTAQSAAYREHDLRAVVDDPAVAAEWDGPFHLEIDTGMGRCGVRWDAAAAIARCATTSMEGVFTHLYAADTAPETVRQQWNRFNTALAAVGRRPALVHAANSAGTWRLEDPLDLVRPGIFLYGGRCGEDLPAPRPAAAVRAPIVSLRQLAPGDTVSYGGDWTATRPVTVATLGVGYADGVFRSLQGKGQVLVNGARRPIVGRVTMDFVMVALRDGDAAAPGTVATLIGRDGASEITLDEHASWAGTISYEIIARLGSRLERTYVRG